MVLLLRSVRSYQAHLGVHLMGHYVALREPDAATPSVHMSIVELSMEIEQGE